MIFYDFYFLLFLLFVFCIYCICKKERESYNKRKIQTKEKKDYKNHKISYQFQSTSDLQFKFNRFKVQNININSKFLHSHSINDERAHWRGQVVHNEEKSEQENKENAHIVSRQKALEIQKLRASQVAKLPRPVDELRKVL